jgi:PhoPQ-activated pathogenicity-related protein
LRVTTQDHPTSVKLWQATDPDARDFRMETLGPRYESNDLTDSGSGVYVAKVAAPAKGWTAFFVELTFPSGCEPPFKFTTQVCVVPDVLPYRFVSQGRPL